MHDACWFAPGYRSCARAFVIRAAGGGLGRRGAVGASAVVRSATWCRASCEARTGSHHIRTQPGGVNLAIAAAQCIIRVVLAFVRPHLRELAGLVVLPDVLPVMPASALALAPGPGDQGLGDDDREASSEKDAPADPSGKKRKANKKHKRDRGYERRTSSNKRKRYSLDLFAGGGKGREVRCAEVGFVWGTVTLVTLERVAFAIHGSFATEKTKQNKDDENEPRNKLHKSKMSNG